MKHGTAWLTWYNMARRKKNVNASFVFWWVLCWQKICCVLIWKPFLSCCGFVISEIGACGISFRTKQDLRHVITSNNNNFVELNHENSTWKLTRGTIRSLLCTILRADSTVTYIIVISCSSPTNRTLVTRTSHSPRFTTVLLFLKGVMRAITILLPTSSRSTGKTAAETSTAVVIVS